jgi:outer membrane protein assembly factor BamB
MRYIRLSGSVFTAAVCLLAACSPKSSTVDPLPFISEDLVLAKTGPDGLTAIEAETGAVKWQISGVAQFALDGKDLFVNDSKLHRIQAFTDTTTLYAEQDTSRNLSVINPATGQITSAVKNELKPSYMVGCCGTYQLNQLIKVSDGVAYMGLREVDYGITFKYSLFATDIKTGTQKWVSDLNIGQPLTLSISSDKLYVGTMNGAYVMDKNTGKILKKHLSAQLPAVTEDIYLLYTEESLTAIEKTNGSVRWSYPTGQYMMTPPSVFDGLVYFTDSNKKLLALDVKTGAKKWEYLIENSDRLSSSAQVMDGVLYVSNPNGKIYALEAQTGKKKWQVWAGDGLYMAPGELIAKNNRLYVPLDNKKLFVLDARNGQKIWEISFSVNPDNLLTSFQVVSRDEINQ